MKTVHKNVGWNICFCRYKYGIKDYGPTSDKGLQR